MRFLLIILFLTFSHTSAHALSCEKDALSLAEKFINADVVFLGEVDGRDKDDIVTVKPLEIFKNNGFLSKEKSYSLNVPKFVGYLPANFDNGTQLILFGKFIKENEFLFSFPCGLSFIEPKASVNLIKDYIEKQKDALSDLADAIVTARVVKVEQAKVGKVRKRIKNNITFEVEEILLFHSYFEENNTFELQFSCIRPDVIVGSNFLLFLRHVTIRKRNLPNVEFFAPLNCLDNYFVNMNSLEELRYYSKIQKPANE